MHRKLRNQIFLLLAIALSACEHTEKKMPPMVVIRKVVRSKKEAQETSYRYKYNLWKGNFYHVPDIHTVYYLVYTDGTYEAVDLGTFATVEAGDTIKQSRRIVQ
jgi:hypothetical protein